MGDLPTLSMQTSVIPKEPYVSRLHWSPWARFGQSPPEIAAKQRFHLFSARNGIFHALRLLAVRRDSTILIPSYLCTAAVQPIVAYGAGVEFYSVTREGNVDLEDLKTKLSTRTSAVVVVHYFGFPQPIGQIRRFCDEHGLVLLEDCAHVFQGMEDGQPLGSWGDASVFSWRKFLPVYDGATLLINRPISAQPIELEKESIWTSLKVAKNIVEGILAQGPAPCNRALMLLDRVRGRLTRHMVTDMANGGGGGSKIGNTHGDDFHPASVSLPMSCLSRWIKSHSNVDSIVVARCSNYEYLWNRLSYLRGVRPLYGLPKPGVCPWVFPVFFDGCSKPHHALREMGIPAVTWGGVRPTELVFNQFPEADDLYEHLVFLPIHQCLTHAHLDTIVRAATIITEK